MQILSQRADQSMQIQRRSATEQDIPLIDAWANAIDAGRFMSRYLPDRLHKILWEIIVVDGVDIGTVWAETRPRLPDVIFLGILIGRSELFGKGGGRSVIRDVITEVPSLTGDVAIRLHVRRNNARAIACYTKCGFVEIASGEKIGRDGTLIPTITMQFSPDAPRG